MAHYTITIKTLLDNNFDFGLNSASSYPIFDETYRNTLNTKILNHYYLDEIGFETPTLFKKMLLTRLNEIMPYYNTLYENQLDKLENILDNVDIRETMDRDYTNSNSKTENVTNSTTTGGNSTSSSTSDNKNLFQNTPQGRITQSDINSQTWATNVTFDHGTIADTSTTSGTSSSTNATTDTRSGTSTDDYIKHITGNNGKKYNVELIDDLRKNLLNIDMMIIDELYDLFMGLIV